MTRQTTQSSLRETVPNIAQTALLLQRSCLCGQQTPGGKSCATCSNDELELQRSTTNSSRPDTVPSIVHEVLATAGSSMDAATRGHMESRFAHDFSSVRIHRDAQASDSAQAVNAAAYTVGNHVAFASGQYNPQTRAGQKLLAHELTHVVQQSGRTAYVNRSIQIGDENTSAEIEADRVSEYVLSDRAKLRAPLINAPSNGIALQRRPATPQRRGDRPRLASLDLPNRGEDQVRIKIFRYLCDCRGTNVTRTSFDAHVQPQPGVTFLFCRGRTTLNVSGEVVPSSISTGRATVTGDLNIAPGRNGVGLRVRVQGEVRNTGDEPEIGGRAEGTIETRSGLPDFTASGEVFRGTESGQFDTSVGGGVLIGATTIGLDVTNPQDDGRRGGRLTIGVPFGGPSVQRDVCRKCECPVAYECLEYVPSRSFEEQVPHTVRERSRLRYYFRLNSNQEAHDPLLQAESQRSLNQLVQNVSNGFEVFSIKGFASPEAGEATRNQELSTIRAERLREIIAPRLGPDVILPPAEPGGELLGSVPTIAAGSDLSDAILDTGFGNAEDVSDFLFGDEIANAELTDQFIALLNRVTEPEDRLRLFGVRADAPVAAQLLAAIDQFLTRGGRSQRPWERVFEFLRFATIELIETRQEVRTEQRQTSGSVRSVGEAVCNRFAHQAEDQNLFGPAESNPSALQCPLGEPVNAADFEDKCHYRD